LGAGGPPGAGFKSKGPLANADGRAAPAPNQTRTINITGGATMTVIKWDPSINIAALQDRINRLFRDAFPGPDGPEEEFSECNWSPQVDILETEDGIVIQADLPGVNKEDVSVEAKENILSIKGVRTEEFTVPDERYYRRERCCGTFERSFAMRFVIAPDQIKASFKNGVLKIELPKFEQERPKKININID
jgi:HSP20 family protein